MRIWSGEHFGLSAQLSRKLNQFRSRYAKMPVDPHLFDGEGERFRRYARFLINPRARSFEIFDHHAFYQDKKFDVLYGDIHRRFAPLEASDYRNDFFQMLLIETFESLPIPERFRRVDFEVSAHMIRIESTASSSIGRPAPEGIHRDGYHFGSIHLMRRDNLSGADNKIYDLKKNLLKTVSLNEPLDSLYFDDAAILHGVSSFTRVDQAIRGTRDMLILLYQPLSESPQTKTASRILRHY